MPSIGLREISPHSFSSAPVIMLSRVDFPAPFAPINPIRESSCTLAVICSRMVFPAKETPISCIESSIVFSLHFLR